MFNLTFHATQSIFYASGLPLLPNFGYFFLYFPSLFWTCGLSFSRRSSIFLNPFLSLAFSYPWSIPESFTISGQFQCISQPSRPPTKNLRHVRHQSTDQLAEPESPYKSRLTPPGRQTTPIWSLLPYSEAVSPESCFSLDNFLLSSISVRAIAYLVTNFSLNSVYLKPRSSSIHFLIFGNQLPCCIKR